MGSEKYPDENSFDDFIQRTGGSDNAHTDCETTVFYFETQRKSFREGRDEISLIFFNVKNVTFCGSQAGKKYCHAERVAK